MGAPLGIPTSTRCALMSSRVALFALLPPPRFRLHRRRFSTRVLNAGANATRSRACARAASAALRALAAALALPTRHPSAAQAPPDATAATAALGRSCHHLHLHHLSQLSEHARLLMTAASSLTATSLTSSLATAGRATPAHTILAVRASQMSVSPAAPPLAMAGGAGMDDAISFALCGQSSRDRSTVRSLIMVRA